MSDLDINVLGFKLTAEDIYLRLLANLDLFTVLYLRHLPKDKLDDFLDNKVLKILTDINLPLDSDTLIYDIPIEYIGFSSRIYDIVTEKIGCQVLMDLSYSRYYNYGKDFICNMHSAYLNKKDINYLYKKINLFINKLTIIPEEKRNQLIEENFSVKTVREKLSTL